MSAQARFASALLDPEQPPPADLIAWHGGAVTQRYAVYRNNVAAALVDALAGTFAVTQQLVGVDFFRAMALVYARQTPPRSPILSDYGASFAEFIERFPPAASVPYLSSVARLEWSWLRALLAPEPPTGAEQRLRAATASPDLLPERRAELHPSLGLVCAAHAIVSIWAAHQGLRDLGSTDPEIAENALILRPDQEVEVRAISDADACFVTLLQEGRCLGEAAEIMAARQADFDLVSTLTQLIRWRALIALY